MRNGSMPAATPAGCSPQRRRWARGLRSVMRRRPRCWSPERAASPTASSRRSRPPPSATPPRQSPHPLPPRPRGATVKTPDRLRPAPYLAGLAGAAAVALTGVWLVVAPFAVGYQPDGADWVDATIIGVATGAGLIVLG